MQPNNPEDKIYEEWGVTPPERNPHGTEQDLQNIMSRYVKHGLWSQKGNVITCHKCPMPHSHSIATHYILKGTDEAGLPNLEKLV